MLEGFICADILLNTTRSSLLRRYINYTNCSCLSGKADGTSDVEYSWPRRYISYHSRSCSSGRRSAQATWTQQTCGVE